MASAWMIVCSVCGKEVTAQRVNKRYCSRACQMKAFRAREKRHTKDKNK